MAVMDLRWAPVGLLPVSSHADCQVLPRSPAAATAATRRPA